MAETMLGFTRPVWFDNESENWEYGSHGTSVVLRWEDRLFVVTSAHGSKSYRPDQVMFPYESGGHHFLPIDNVFSIDTGEEDDTDHMDIRVFSVCDKLFDPSKISSNKIFDLSWNKFQSRTASAKYFLAGYPNELNEIDYEKKHAKQTGTLIPLELNNLDRFKGMDEYTVSNRGGLQSLQGFSGGGVFSVTPTKPNQGNLRWEGILLKGSIESMRCYVLKSDFVRSYIEGISQELDESC